MIFHIDGNSFYASCERVFRPDLQHSPIAVLSNNDGIIVALNAECKALGYKRGDVFYKNKYLMEQQGVAVFSSNYTLYADMSARLNVIYARYTPDVELYSIDESFLFFPDWSNANGEYAAYTAIALDIKTTAERETGIPVSIGVAPTKTLAKLCNKLAKKNANGICDYNAIDQAAALRNYPVEDIWGVGHSKAAYLKRRNITTALSLKNYPLHKAKQNLTINGFRTVQELNGIAAIDRIEETDRQLVSVSRSFQSPVYELADIAAALSAYTQEAVSRMRADHLSCRYISVYLMTNAYADGGQYANQMSAELPYLSAYLPEITATANELLKRIYRHGYKYRKVMIALAGLDRDRSAQLDLFNTTYNRGKQLEPLMQAADNINNRYGRATLRLACGLADTAAAPTALKRGYLSPSYTTKIADIPVVL
jgi:DNA polymerase V